MGVSAASDILPQAVLRINMWSGAVRDRIVQTSNHLGIVNGNDVMQNYANWNIVNNP